ncbi:MAG: ABC transporter substrate-binding protein [Saccharospirillum sp.]|uniref:ABC transporter substrate-binding protein n=1 Tax=Saccharospirillum sp. TaxID=2033801 RepID=UPI0032977107
MRVSLLPVALVATSLAFCTSALAEQGAINVLDQNDRPVVLDEPAQRVATIPMPAASMFTSVAGGVDRLAAMHPASKTALEEGILGEFYPDASTIPSDIVGNGFMPNIESLLTVNPDLVLQWAHRGTDIIEPLEQAGLTVATLNYGTEELAQGWIQLLGELLGEEEKSQRMIQWRDQTLADIRDQLADVTEAEKPRTLYFLRFLSEYRVAAEGTYNDFYIDLAGGANPAEGNNWLTIDAEQILNWDPEVILLNGFEAGLSPQDVYDNPLFADVSAVVNRRVYHVPLGGYRWDPPNQESPLMWMWLTSLLQPDQVDYDLRHEMRDAYQWIYGQTPSENQLNAILRVEHNQNAAGYERFLSPALASQ